MHISSCDIVMRGSGWLAQVFPRALCAVSVSIMSVANAYNSVAIIGSNWVWFKFQDLINRIIFLWLFVCNNITFGCITEALIWWITQSNISRISKHMLIFRQENQQGKQIEIQQSSSWNALSYVFLHLVGSVRLIINKARRIITIRTMSLSAGVFMWHVTLSLSITNHAL